jgi:acyl-CoA synthetase (NDP forming)
LGRFAGGESPPAGGGYLAEDEAKKLLWKYGIQIPREEVVHGAAEAAEAAGRIGFPVVLKVISADLPHKTEAGGVRLGLASAEAVAAAHGEMLHNVAAYSPDARITGVLVAEQVFPEHELLCGIKRDSQFGPVIALGLGGIFVEILRDVVFGVAPLDRIEALEMIGAMRGAPILAGARGKTPVDVNRLADVLTSLSCLAIDHPDVKELDINPLAATKDGRLVALDCLIGLGA